MRLQPGNRALHFQETVNHESFLGKLRADKDRFSNFAPEVKTIDASYFVCHVFLPKFRCDPLRGFRGLRMRTYIFRKTIVRSSSSVKDDDAACALP